MSEMVERVASALIARRALAGREEDPHTLARIAIEAMREPTKAMLKAGTMYVTPPHKVWPAMIDAALK